MGASSSPKSRVADKTAAQSIETGVVVWLATVQKGRFDLLRDSLKKVETIWIRKHGKDEENWGQIDEDVFFFLQDTIVWLAIDQVGGFGVLRADKFSKVGKDEENSARHSYLPERQVWCVRATEILSLGHT